MSITPRRHVAAVALAAAIVAAPTSIAAAGQPSVSPSSPSAPQASALRCMTNWGSGAKSSRLMTGVPIVNVRAGRHACFDRLVIDLARLRPTVGYYVSYERAVVLESGKTLALRGGAKLAVRVKAPAYDANGRSTYHPRNRKELVNVTGFRTFRQVAYGDSFEGVTTFGLGVRARLPFRVFVFKNSTHQMLVVDVAHHW